MSTDIGAASYTFCNCCIASVIFANHYLIAQGMGFLVIPEKDVPEFKKLLVQYYEGEPLEVIGAFLKERCWKNF